MGNSKKAVERRVEPLVVQWCGRCKHANKAFYVPHIGLCVHCYHPDESVSGEPGWASLRDYKETRSACGSWGPRAMHNSVLGPTQS